MKKLLMIIALSTATISAFAFDAADVAKTLQLKDGTTVHVFKDGKMAMEDKYGNAISMNPGDAMETLDGKKISMRGNEVMRLESIRVEGRVPG